VQHICGWGGGQYPSLDKFRFYICYGYFHCRFNSLSKVKLKVFYIVWCLNAKKLKMFTQKCRGIDAQGHCIVNVDLESTNFCILFI
jgi:hypothetical protein